MANGIPRAKLEWPGSRRAARVTCWIASGALQSHSLAPARPLASACGFRHHALGRSERRQTTECSSQWQPSWSPRALTACPRRARASGGAASGNQSAATASPAIAPTGPARRPDSWTRTNGRSPRPIQHLILSSHPSCASARFQRPAACCRSGMDLWQIPLRSPRHPVPARARRQERDRRPAVGATHRDA